MEHSIAYFWKGFKPPSRIMLTCWTSLVFSKALSLSMLLKPLFVFDMFSGHDQLSERGRSRWCHDPILVAFHQSEPQLLAVFAASDWAEPCVGASAPTFKSYNIWGKQPGRQAQCRLLGGRLVGGVDLLVPSEREKMRMIYNTVPIYRSHFLPAEPGRKNAAGNNTNSNSMASNASNNNIGGASEKLVCLGEIYMAIQWQPKSEGFGAFGAGGFCGGFVIVVSTDIFGFNMFQWLGLFLCVWVLNLLLSLWSHFVLFDFVLSFRCGCFRHWKNQLYEHIWAL